MTEYMPGGRRRIDRVLAPDFLAGLADLELADIRARRMEADQEEVDLSYARRLLQGRIDILKAEQENRRTGRPTPPPGSRGDEAIVEALTRILADDRRGDHGLGKHMTATPSRVGEHRREAERAVADVGGSDVSGMDDLQLTDAVEGLTAIERTVSRSRRQVQNVVDTLTAEIARRYQMAGTR
ncbi:aerial mycelium formation protein [Spongisporangium articulatum]|uniref:Aerial mycelium formation protein n=1 Tax=Spongisporangium articulatum TaxID=3362603 RepID=A0ABW8AJR3_9ACTN